MSDWMVDASQMPWVRQAIKGASLPLSLPQALRRGEGPVTATPLAGLRAEVLAVGDTAPLLDWLVAAGAVPIEAGSEEPALDILVVDARSLDDPDSLDRLHAWLPPRIRRIRPCGRVVFLTKVLEEVGAPSAVAAQGAVEGVMRSLAKELGRKGITVNQLAATERAEGRIEGALRFLGSPRSAFITGQRIVVSHSARAPSDWGWERSLEGRVALVTGAARGIGAAIAARLSEEGAHVVCMDRPGMMGEAQTLADSIDGSAFGLDVTEPDAAERVVAHLQAEFGGVDIVVHNAGVTRDRTLARMSEDEWNLVMEVNLRAILRIQDALDAGPMASFGRVLVLSSVMGVSGNAGQVNYAATKSALRTWVAAAAAAQVRRGITVNAIAPGFIETQMTRAIPMVTREFGRRLSALSQGGEPRDVAELAAFLASPGAHGITGQNIRVCGGMFFGA